MPKRILVLSASVGAGHMRAAQAVELALRETDPNAGEEKMFSLSSYSVVTPFLSSVVTLFSFLDSHTLLRPAGRRAL